MRGIFLICSFLLCCVSVTQANTYNSGGEFDPLLRSASFEAATRKPYQAVANILQVTSVAPYTGISEKSKLQLSASLFELGIDGREFSGRFPIAAVQAGYQEKKGSEENGADAFLRYNTAVSLVGEGRNTEALELMEAIASSDYSLEEERLLRDKTNLALGYHYLDRYQFKTASIHFERVRRLSPYGKRALIGLGWSLLNPDNTSIEDDGLSGQEYLWFGSGDDIARARRRTPFRHSWSIVSGEKKKDLLRAMVPWMELINDDPLDPAVQEGMLTLPYAMVHLGDVNKAVKYYQTANERLNGVLNYLDAAIAKIERGQLTTSIVSTDRETQSGWDIWLCSLLVAPDTEYLNLLVEDADFLWALRDFRQFLSISHSLQPHHQQILNYSGVNAEAAELSARFAKFFPILEGAVKDARVRLEKVALNVLLNRRRQTESYLAESRFALARIHENPRKELKRYIQGEWQ